MKKQNRPFKSPGVALFNSFVGKKDACLFSDLNDLLQTLHPYPALKDKSFDELKQVIHSYLHERGGLAEPYDETLLFAVRRRFNEDKYEYEPFELSLKKSFVPSPLASGKPKKKSPTIKHSLENRLSGGRKIFIDEKYPTVQLHDLWLNSRQSEKTFVLGSEPVAFHSLRQANPILESLLEAVGLIPGDTPSQDHSFVFLVSLSSPTEIGYHAVLLWDRIRSYAMYKYRFNERTVNTALQEANMSRKLRVYVSDAYCDAEPMVFFNYDKDSMSAYHVKANPYDDETPLTIRRLDESTKQSWKDVLDIELYEIIDNAREVRCSDVFWNIDN